MKMLLNTLFITKPEAYLALDGENILVLLHKEIIARIPLHNIEGVVTFGHQGASPRLMEKLSEMNISLAFLSASGKFRARVQGPINGNVHLRRTQYRYADNEMALHYAKSFISAKIHNQRMVLQRAIRDHALRLDTETLEKVAQELKQAIPGVWECNTQEELRGIEGLETVRYFSVMDELILNQKEDFFFQKRTRRPPLDRFNCLLSFLYVLLSFTATSALETVGLDPYVGMMHTDRAGRKSLALDLIEELRAPFADRLALAMVNLKQVQANDFEEQENGAFYLTDEGRKKVLTAWQNKKSEKIEHPYLKEKIFWGLIPHAQAMLLARTIRGDLDTYPPFLWR